MLIIKKIFFYITITIIIWILIGLIIGLYNLTDKKVGDGYFITQDVEYKTLYSTKNSNLVLYGILDYVYNNKYILIVKLKGSGYECDFSNKKIFSKEIEFFIIDKINDKVFSTENEKNFLMMRKKLSIVLKFNLNYKLFNKILKKSKYIHYNYDTSKCKDINSYPIIKY